MSDKECTENRQKNFSINCIDFTKMKRAENKTDLYLYVDEIREVCFVYF